MFRLFIIIGLGVSMLVTSACDSKNHRIPLRKSDGKGSGQASARTDSINKAIDGDKTCLRVDLLIGEMMKQKDETILINTYDLDMGRLTSGANKSELNFTSELDANSRAHFFLKHPDEPILEVVAAQDLRKSTKAFLLSPALVDEKCETVSFENVVKAQFEVIKGVGNSSNTLWLRNKTDSREFIRYTYNRKDKLYITHFTPSQNAACGRQPPLLMRKYVVARETGLDKIEMDRGFARLIVDNIQAPLELTTEFTKDGRSSERVSVNYAAMTRIHEILNDDAFVPPACK